MLKDIRADIKGTLHALSFRPNSVLKVASERIARGEPVNRVANDLGLSQSTLTLRVLREVSLGNATALATKTLKTDDALIEIFKGNGLSTRSVNSLLYHGMTTIGEARAVLAKADVKGPTVRIDGNLMYNFGSKSISEVFDFLNISIPNFSKPRNGRGVTGIVRRWEARQVSTEKAMKEIALVVNGGKT